METQPPPPQSAQSADPGPAWKGFRTCSSVHLGKQRKPYSFLLQTVWDARVPLGLCPALSSASDLVLNWFKVWRKASEERIVRVLKCWSHPKDQTPKDLYGHQRAIKIASARKAVPKNNSCKLHLMCLWMMEAEVCVCARTYVQWGAWN